MAAPGAEFYFATVRRASAVPAGHRSRDVVCLLRAHQLLDKAAAVLAPQGAASEAEQLRAVLKILVGAFLLPPLPLEHPGIGDLTSEPFITLASPLVECTPQPNSAGFGLTATPRLQELAAPGALLPPDVGEVARLLLASLLFARQPGNLGANLAVALTLLALVERSLEQGPTAAAWAGQLQHMGLGGSAAAAPALKQLHALALVMALHAVTPASLGSGGGGNSSGSGSSSEGVRRSLGQEALAAARRLVKLQPLHPRSHRLLADVASHIVAAQLDTQAGAAGGRLGRGAPPLTAEQQQACQLAARHYEAGLELAREQGSDLLEAMLAVDLGGAAMLAGGGQGASSSPSPWQVEQLWQEAHAAYKRCRGHLPWRWVLELQRREQAIGAARPHLEAHLQRSGDQWSSELREEASNAMQRGRAATQAWDGSARKCAGCGRTCLATQLCPACHEAQYCRWVVLPEYTCLGGYCQSTPARVGTATWALPAWPPSSACRLLRGPALQVGAVGVGWGAG